MITGYTENVEFLNPTNMYEVNVITFRDGTRGISLRLRDTGPEDIKVAIDFSADSAKKFVDYLNEALKQL